MLMDNIQWKPFIFAGGGEGSERSFIPGYTEPFCNLWKSGRGSSKGIPLDFSLLLLTYDVHHYLKFVVNIQSRVLSLSNFTSRFYTCYALTKSVSCMPSYMVYFA